MSDMYGRKPFILLAHRIVITGIGVRCCLSQSMVRAGSLPRRTGHRSGWHVLVGDGQYRIIVPHRGGTSTRAYFLRRVRYPSRCWAKVTRPDSSPVTTRSWAWQAARISHQPYTDRGGGFMWECRCAEPELKTEPAPDRWSGCDSAGGGPGRCLTVMASRVFRFILGLFLGFDSGFARSIMPSRWRRRRDAFVLIDGVDRRGGFALIPLRVFRKRTFDYGAQQQLILGMASRRPDGASRYVPSRS